MLYTPNHQTNDSGHSPFECIAKDIFRDKNFNAPCIIPRENQERFPFTSSCMHVILSVCLDDNAIFILQSWS